MSDHSTERLTGQAAAADGIAIVGMAGRFPGAPDVDTFWSNLCAGVESVQSFSDDDLRAAGADTGDPAFVNAGAQMEGIDEFDAGFFGMGRREAELTDPQHRVVLETAWAALENAGYDPATTDGRIGIFGGVGRNQYFRHNLQTHPELLAMVGDHPVMLANEREYAVLRTAFKLGLRGPALSVNTACSTSGVATHLAVQSLLAGDSDMALAGGARLVVPARAGYVYQEGGILSADGHVRAFDADARGTVIAGGVAFIALKRLEDAIEDADTIYAVIRGSAINNDGAAKMGLTAPGIDGQAEVIEDALMVAEVDAGSIGMVEAHGTATSLGDPIEIAAITRAYRRHTSRRQYCSIGSLKSNVGHLDCGAGVAGIIKAALSLHHGLIPPSINYSSPNPQIDFESSPFFVHSDLREWKRADEPRRAGVSSFGFGGTNAHIVLEEAPRPEPVPDAPVAKSHILVLSAKTLEALEGRRRLLADDLASHAQVDLADAAYTLAVGRARMPCRAAVVADDTDSAIRQLRLPAAQSTVTRTSAATGAEVAFLFTGQGAQYVGMGADLYRSEPVFAEAMQTCALALGGIDGEDLIDLLYGEHEDTAAAGKHLLRTEVGQPAIFALQYALARLWASWGVEPAAIVGHSVGELAAACIGGVFTLEDAMRLAAARGRLMQDLPIGAMTAVLGDEAAVVPLLDEETSLAAVNAPEQCVASGPPASIDALECRLTAADIPFRRLPTDRAFHSPMMEPALDPLRDHVDGTRRSGLRIPMVSTVTGAWVSDGELADPLYWVRHARRTVRFADAVGVLLTERPELVLLEIGPGETLTALVRQYPELSPESAVISTLPHRSTGPGEAIHPLRAPAAVWAAGADVDLVAVNGGHRRRIPLPTYPFARERYWIEATPGAAAASSGQLSSAGSSAAPGAAVAVADSDDGADADTPSKRVDEQLISILAVMSGLDEAALDATASFTDLGFDSLFLAQVNSQVRRQFRVRVPLGQLLGETPTIDSLAAFVERELEAPRSTPAGAERPIDEVTGTGGTAASAAAPDADHARPIPLLPNVTRFMRERHTPHAEHWNLGVLLDLTDRLEPETTRRVVAALLERHDALRLRIAADDGDYASSIAPVTEPLPFATTDLSGMSPSERLAAVEQRADELQASFDLANGPLIRVELFDLGEQGQRLLVVVHHFALDQLSWRPFWEDFIALYDEFAHGASVAPPPPATSFEDWAQALQRRADSDALRSEIDLWRTLPWQRIEPIPLDHPGGANTNASSDSVECAFTPGETTALLRHTPGVVRKADLILTALARTFAAWTGTDTVLIDMMGHGRYDGIADDVDPMESVGFFISYTPLVLRLAESGAEPAAPSLTDQIEPLMRRSLDFDLLRFMAADAGVREALQGLPRAEILFNHHGQLDEPDELPRSSRFRAAAESIGSTHSPSGIRYYPIAVTSKIHYGRLRVDFVYSANLHERSTIVALADEFRSQLVALVARVTA